MSKELIKDLVFYAWPEISRGPASRSWIRVMRKAAKELGWDVCTRCDGEGEHPVVSTYRSKDCCYLCRGIGYVDFEE